VHSPSREAAASGGIGIARHPVVDTRGLVRRKSGTPTPKMADRRKANRFVLPERVHGWLRVLEDVYIERVGQSAIVVVVARPPMPDEELLLDLVPQGGHRRVLRVRRAHSASAGPLERERYRVTVVPAQGTTFFFDGPPAPRDLSPLGIGVLVRRIPMTLGEISAKGCLIETRHALPAGTVGVLELEREEGYSTEPVRICRMVHIAGGAVPYAAGAEFLPLEPPAPASVRNSIARLEMVLEADSRMKIELTAG
jgi:hypothetical protein